MSNNNITITLTVNDKGTPVIQKFSGNVKGMSADVEKHGSLSSRVADTVKNKWTTTTEMLKRHWAAFSAAGIAALYAIERGISALLGKYEEFQSALVAMARVTSRPLGQIKSEILAMNPALGSSTDLMKGYYQTISAGVKDPVKAMETLTVAAKAAKAAHFDQSETIKALTKMMAGYEGEIKNVTDASDLLFMIEKEGQTTFAELVPVIGNLATISHTLNVRQEEMAAGLATITKVAGSTAEASTQYESVLAGLIRENEVMTEALKELGYESAQALIEEKGLIGGIRELSETSVAAEKGLLKLFGRKEALMGATALLANESAAYNDSLKVMENRAGATEEAFRKWQKTFEGIKETFKATIGKVMIDLGEKLAPTVATAMKNISKYLEENKDQTVEWAKSAGTSFYKIGLGIAHIADAFRGWKTIWLGLKSAFAVFALAINQGFDKMLKKMLAVARAVGADETAFSIAKALKRSTDNQKYWNNTIDESVAALNDLVAERSYVDAYKETFAAITRKTESLNDTLEDTPTPIKEVIRKMQDAEARFAALERSGVSAGEAIVDAAEGAAGAVGGIKDKAEELPPTLDSVGTYWKQTFENIHNATADTFYNIFKDGELGFKGLIDNIKDWFLKLLSEMAAQAVARPIIVPIVSSVAGAMGMGSEANAAMSSMGMSGGPGSGFLSGVLGYKMGGTTFGGALGAAGLGALGYSTIGGALGLPQGGYSGVGSALGAGVASLGAGWMGAMGGAAGSALGSAMGMGSGVAMGAAMGSVVPIIGTAIGAGLGGALGSLIGGDDENRFTLKKTIGEYSGQYTAGMGIATPDAARESFLTSHGNDWFDSVQEAWFSSFDSIIDTFNNQVSGVLSIIPAEQAEALEKQLESISFAMPWKGTKEWDISDAEKMLEKYTGEYSALLVNQYESAVQAIGYASIEAWEEYVAMMAATTQASAQTIGDALKTTLDAQGSFTDFATNIKTSIYDNIKEGIITALMESTLYKSALQPFFQGISESFETAFSGGAFNMQSFESLVSPYLTGLNSAISVLQTPFDYITGALGSIGSTLGVDVAMAGGGVITEPIVGVGRSGTTYAFGENGTETVTPGAGNSESVVIPVYIDSTKITEIIYEKTRDGQPIVHERGITSI